MALPRHLILRGTGFLRSYSLGDLAASGLQSVAIAQTDIDFVTFYNVVNIVNRSSVAVDFYPDGDTARFIRVAAGAEKTVSGPRFQRLVQKNLSGATATGADNVSVTIMKELGLREQIELSGEG
jgi:hypothetical protein